MTVATQNHDLNDLLNADLVSNLQHYHRGLRRIETPSPNYDTRPYLLRMECTGYVLIRNQILKKLLFPIRMRPSSGEKKRGNDRSQENATRRLRGGGVLEGESMS